MNIDIEAECQDDYMKIRIGFNGSFTGLLYSAGKHNALSQWSQHSFHTDPEAPDQRVWLTPILVPFLQSVFPYFQLNVFVFNVTVTGYAYDPDCMYINGSGRDYYEFYIQLNRCGTLGKNAISEKSRENPTVIMTVAFCGLRVYTFLSASAMRDVCAQKACAFSPNTAHTDLNRCMNTYHTCAIHIAVY